MIRSFIEKVSARNPVKFEIEDEAPSAVLFIVQ